MTLVILFTKLQQDCLVGDCHYWQLYSELKLEPEEVLTFSSEIESVPDLWAINGLRPHIVGHEMESERYTHGLVKVVVSRRSSIIGRKISELPVPESPYKVNLVAISRGGMPVGGAMRDIRLVPL